jgi:dipeptidyl-peptidase-4
MCGRVVLLVALSIAGAASAAAQQRSLTLDAIYDPAARESLGGRPASGFAWMDEQRYLWPRDSADGTEWAVAQVQDDSVRPLFDPARMEAALVKLPGIGPDASRRLARSRDLIFDAAWSAAMVTHAGDLYLYRIVGDRAVRLTATAGVEDLPSFSPDGRLVAFVRDANLYVVDVASQRETRLTRDGSAKILNGRLDWVYEEEIFGRGQKRAYWWSPDSSRLAFLRIDDTPVSPFIVVDDIPYEQEVERWDYPRAGTPNPEAAIGVVRASGGSIRWIDLTKYPSSDRLIVGLDWASDRQLVYEIQNRIQTWMDLNVADPSSGATRTLLRETTPAWVNPPEGAHPLWLRDGTFLWLSERTGWRHLYHFSADGRLIRPVTSGKWELRTLHGIEESSGWVFFSATERSHIGRDVYRVRLDGSGFERLSIAEGTHTALFNPTFSHYVDTWSNATTPPQVRLHKSGVGEVRVLDSNTASALGEFKLSKPEFLTVSTRDGFAMEAMMIKPPDFDPSHRYPVYQFTYGGPASPQVRNAWGGSTYLYHQFLAQQGIIVWICDNRTASGKGAESAWPVYRRFGELELQDIEDGVAWLKRQPYVDPTRIGLHGWSYGGYMTLFALTHSRSFAMGIAGGPVTDWRDYDTVYTERFMGLPEENADAYRRSSPRWFAKELSAPLLLIHGTMDDNVHVANTLQFAYELQQAQRPFRMMLYAKSRHGITDPSLAKHLRAMMVDFIVEHLKKPLPGGTDGAR